MGPGLSVCSAITGDCAGPLASSTTADEPGLPVS